MTLKEKIIVTDIILLHTMHTPSPMWRPGPSFFLKKKKKNSETRWVRDDKKSCLVLVLWVGFINGY